MTVNCPACNKSLALQSDSISSYYECALSLPYHFYYQEELGDYIRFDKEDSYYFLIFKDNSVLEIWTEISGKGDRKLFSIACSFDDFSRLCKLDNKDFNSKLKLLQVFS